MNRILALLFFVSFLPIVIMIYILIFIFDLQNPIFSQDRIGKDMIKFKIFKFRTMKNENVTYLGKILRKFSLDEILQLLNIINGSMNFIGPRPLIEETLNMLEPKKIQFRQSIKPGITGYAQIQGRNELSQQNKFIYDIDYIKRKNLILDLYILIGTLKVIIHKDHEFKI